MTQQELFDYVVSALLKQGGPSVNDEGCCQYRGPDGRACAVGVLLKPEDEVAEGISFEDSLTGDGYSRLTAETKELFCEHGGLLEALQEAHDSTSDSTKGNDWNKELFEQNFRHVADEFGLDYHG